MKTASVAELKKDLKHYSQDELVAFCLRLSKFKKENKELLTYLLFEAHNEDAYIENVKNDIDAQFAEINASNYYFIKKSVRKILSGVKKQIRFSQQKETEVALLLHFCQKLKQMKPSYKRNVVLENMYNNQLRMIKNKLATLHEDLQYDFGLELEKLTN